MNLKIKSFSKFFVKRLSTFAIPLLLIGALVTIKAVSGVSDCGHNWPQELDDGCF